MNRIDASRRGAFTLPEALAAIVLVAIVVPVAMRGITQSMALGEQAAQRSEAVAQAQSKLDELIATGAWRSGELTGDFTASPSGIDQVAASTVPMTWTAAVDDAPWPSLRQVAVTVMWTCRGQNRSVTLTTLVDEENAP